MFMTSLQLFHQLIMGRCVGKRNRSAIDFTDFNHNSTSNLDPMYLANT